MSRSKKNLEDVNVDPSTSKILLMPYLLKTEPTVYSFADLQREGTTIWDGVTNPVAVKNLRGMKP
ncbi:MAG: EVE domain-containing protein, partial [Candidatus Sulfotelmatobacter sp.]